MVDGRRVRGAPRSTVRDARHVALVATVAHTGEYNPVTPLVASNLAYIHAARQAMRLVFQELLECEERTHVVLCALDAVPHGVESFTTRLPCFAWADCYNSAYAACLDVQRDRESKSICERIP